jgi:enoyl-CoA hydratase
MPIRFETNVPLALIVIEEPNRLDIEVIDELAGAFERIGRDNSVRVCILTGSNQIFAITDIAELAKLDPESGRLYAGRGQALMRQIEQLGKPVIAAINGDAFGAGLELALACTFRLASDNASLGQPEVKLGLIPGFGGARRLARLIGAGRALELMLTGESIGVEEGYRLGLINQVMGEQELFRAARDLAQRVSNNSPLAIKYCLEAVISGLEMPCEDALFLEATLFGLCCATAEMREETRVYFEKRLPFPGEIVSPDVQS